MDVFLDLKDKAELSFGKNQERFDKAFDLKTDTNYKLAVSLKNTSEIEMISFQISY